MNPNEILARLALASVTAVGVALGLADDFVSLVRNPTGSDLLDNYDQGVAIGKLMGICALMNEITGSYVDYADLVSAAFERADG